MSAYLFAYGTLLPGHAPVGIAVVVDRLTVVGDGFVQGRLYDLGDFPGAVLDGASAERVFGTVYELPNDPDILRALDAYEEFDLSMADKSQFVRMQCSVTLTSGTVLDAWIYVYPRTPAPERLVPGGVFRRS
jgi:gamma-glutamylcyclotransferase (GGCT)/AIG2-like uncharacterized protein YtfP